jgi:hypothetical protein
MGDETLYATKGYQSIIRWCDPTISKEAYIVQRTLSVGGDTAKAGDVMSADGETIGLVDVAAESDVQIAGILMGPTRPGDDYDLDDTIADGTTVDILRPTGGRMMVSVILDSTATTGADIEEFDYIRVGSTAGHVELFVYLNAADSTDTFELVVGKAAEVMANHTADDRVFTIWY